MREISFSCRPTPTDLSLPVDQHSQTHLSNVCSTVFGGATVFTGLAVLIDDAALGELCLAVFTGTCLDFVTTVVGTKFLLGCG
ncbi:hypothetical protein Tco_1304261 [Tanacetum coccineum]